MYNTMQVEEIPADIDDRRLLGDRQLPLYLAPPASERRTPKKRTGIFRNDWMTVAALLVCMTTTCTIGIIYVAAFARVTFQADQIISVNAKLLTINAQHEALVKQVAFLQSDNRIAPRATAMKMAQVDAITFVDVPPVQPSGQRLVASAQ
jgi:cell division protein FtsB